MLDWKLPFHIVPLLSSAFFDRPFFSMQDSFPLVEKALAQADLQNGARHTGSYFCVLDL
jgi:hypothetical protein